MAPLTDAKDPRPTPSQDKYPNLRKGGGRPKGAKNKLTTDIMQAMIAQAYGQKKESFRSICRDIMGLHSPEGMTVEGKLLKINGKAVKMRDRLKLMVAEIGLPPADRTMHVTDQDLRLLGTMLANSEGLPGKSAPESDGKTRMPFVGPHGLPWQYDPMALQERQAIEAQKDQEKIDARAKEQNLKGEPEDQVDDEDDGEVPEVVRG